MKNILAENMLRFGTKNLNSKSKDKIKFLVEQEQPKPTDVKPPIVEPTPNNPTDTNFDIFYSKLGPLSKQYWDGTKLSANKQPMAEADKTALYQQFLQRANNKAKANKTTVDEIIKKELDLITIGTSIADVITITKQTPDTPAADPIVITGTYPSVNDPAKLSNFYLEDDATIVLPENIERFKLLIQDLLSAVPKSATITKVDVYAGASTSKVPTTFQGGTYKTIQQGQQNNVFLAQARCQAITQVLSDLIKTEIPNYTGTVNVLDPQLKPNIGPDYTETERTYFFGTGKLDPNKQTEYNEKYGPVKGSYGGVTISADENSKKEFEPTPGEPKVTTIPSAKWSILIRWKQRFSFHDWWKGIPKIFKGKRGGGVVWKEKARVFCPVWE